MTSLLITARKSRVFTTYLLSTILVLSPLAIVTGCVSSSSKDSEGSATGESLDDGASAESASGGDLANEELSDSGAVASADRSGDNSADVANRENSPPGGGEKLDGDLTNDVLSNDPAAPSSKSGSSNAVLSEPPPANDAPSVEASAGKENSASSIASSNSGSGSGDAGAESVSVSDIRYVSKRGGGTVVIDTTAPATYHTREVPSQNQVVIEIANAKLPDRLKRPYVTKDFKQSIEAINAYQDKGSNTARVVLQFKRPSKAAVAQSGNSLTIVSSDSIGDEGSAGTLAENTSSEASPAEGSGSSENSAGDKSSVFSETGSSIKAAKTSLTEGNPDDMKFYGRPISLEFSDTPVREVIAMIAEQSGANIMIASEVDGNISLKLKQVPWDQALLLVMRTKALGYVRQGNVLRVAPLTALQKETEEAHKIVEAQKASEPLKVKVIPVSYATVTELTTQVAPFLSARGKATGDVRTSSLVVTDIPENLQRVANLIHVLDTPPLQVLIEGKVVETTENFSRSLGINWNYTGQQIGTGTQHLSQDIAITPGLPTTQFGKLDISLGTFDIFGDISAILAIAESEDLARIISAPRVLTLNNQTAKINQTTNIPIPKQTLVNGVSSTSYDYKALAMSLEVTPQITSESDVIMKVDLQREFAADSNPTPSTQSRKAETRVLVRNGQTAVIGGVYQADNQETELGIPYLRSIPIVGWLFKSKNHKNQKNELLLFLTPRIMTPEKTLAKEGSSL